MFWSHIRSYLIVCIISVSLAFPPLQLSCSHHTVAVNMAQNNLSKLLNFTEVRERMFSYFFEFVLPLLCVKFNLSEGLLKPKRKL